MNSMTLHSRKYASGFSLVELLLAMLIGLIIIGGILSLFVSSRNTQRSSEDQLNLIADARFAIDAISFDMRHAGMWGGNNITGSIQCYKGAPCPTAAPPAAAGDCEPQWYMDLTFPMIGFNNANAYGSTCTTQGYKPGTDVLVVRYADSNEVLTADLAAGVIYVRGNAISGQVFQGTAEPTVQFKNNDPDFTKNYRLFSHAYYVSSYSDAVGDGVPSLHRVELRPGPIVADEVLLPGVEDFQVQYGIDTDSPKDGFVNTYVNATNVSDWTRVYAAKLWVLMRTNRTEISDISTAQTFTIAGSTVTTANDGYRRYLVSGIVRPRNMIRLDEAEKAGSN